METTLTNAVDQSHYEAKDEEIGASTAVCVGEYEVLKDGEIRLGSDGRRFLDEKKLPLASDVSLSEECRNKIHDVPVSSTKLPSLLRWILQTSSSRHSLVNVNGY